MKAPPELGVQFAEAPLVLLPAEVEVLSGFDVVPPLDDGPAAAVRLLVAEGRHRLPQTGLDQVDAALSAGRQVTAVSGRWQTRPQLRPDTGQLRLQPRLQLTPDRVQLGLSLRLGRLQPRLQLTPDRVQPGLQL